MRTTIVLITLLTLGIPGLAAGSHPQVELRALAARPSYRYDRSAVGPTVLAGTGSAAASNPLVADSSVRGMISLVARPLPGSEAIDVEGSAPPNVSVTITLLATISSGVPTILVSRHDVVTDVNGRFGAVIPIASAFERGTLLEVVATSQPGVTPASAQLIVGAPNSGVSVPLEHLPQDAQ